MVVHDPDSSEYPFQTRNQSDFTSINLRVRFFIKHDQLIRTEKALTINYYIFFIFRPTHRPEVLGNGLRGDVTGQLLYDVAFNLKG